MYVCPLVLWSTQMVGSEYATRYLEQIGVAPSRAALEMVQKNIPLSHKNIKTTFRVRRPGLHASLSTDAGNVVKYHLECGGILGASICAISG